MALVGGPKLEPEVKAAVFEVVLANLHLAHYVLGLEKSLFVFGHNLEVLSGLIEFEPSLSQLVPSLVFFHL